MNPERRLGCPLEAGWLFRRHGVGLMHLARKVRNVLRGWVQAYGTTTLKAYLWNLEFSRGRWNCLDSTPGDCVYQYVERYANAGSILDLGCGSGSTGNELTPTTYHHYTGVDISEVAIAKARRRTEENGRGDKNRHFQSDLLEYAPNQQFDVILFRDSIYYVARGKIKAMLYRYSTYLKEGGVFIVRMADGSGEYKQIMDTIENHFEVLGTYSFDRPKAVVMIFRSRCWIESSPDVFQRGAQDH